MSTNNTSLSIIFAIIRKDLLAAIKNKMILTIIISFSLGMVLYFIAPSLLGNDDLPGLVLVGNATDPLVAELIRNPSMSVILVEDQTEMERILGENDDPLLGIVSSVSVTDEPIIVDAYMDHWVSDAQVATTEQFFETQFSDLFGQTVDLNIHHDVVYTRVDGTHPFNFTFPMIALLLFMGISVAPNLIIEEKETKTLDMLMISPASIAQIITGKAFVAVLYGFLAALVLFVLRNHLVTHWQIALLAAFCGALFTASLGLLMGILLENRQQLIIWSQVVLIGLLLPIFVHAILLDTPVGDLLAFVPTVALGQLVRVALSNDASLSIYIFQLIWLVIVTGLLLLITALLVRRSQNER